MHDYKKALAKAVKEARTIQGLSQERLAEILNLDSRTILNIEAGRGNPKFEILVALITYLKIPTNNIFIQNPITQIKIFKNCLQCYMTVLIWKLDFSYL